MYIIKPMYVSLVAAEGGKIWSDQNLFCHIVGVFPVNDSRHFSSK